MLLSIKLDSRISGWFGRGIVQSAVQQRSQCQRRAIAHPNRHCLRNLSQLRSPGPLCVAGPWDDARTPENSAHDILISNWLKTGCPSVGDFAHHTCLHALEDQDINDIQR